MKGAFLVLCLCILGFVIRFFTRKRKWIKAVNPIPLTWKTILSKEVNFYRSLSDDEKVNFEKRTQTFLLNHRITGIQVELNETDKVLLAASAIIPIFKFPQWRYDNLFEILIYPDTFNHDFETSGDDRLILGMVGSGYMEGKMILSQKALRHGFANDTDKRNTAIHEFIHLIDKMDGAVDGIPALLLDKPYVIPWLELIQKKIEDIYAQRSDINPYGGSNKIEFFAVASEYFFERPKLLAKKHPDLYQLLEEVFDHKMRDRNLNKKYMKIGRNAPCPCSSGKKFKNCCGKKHF